MNNHIYINNPSRILKITTPRRGTLIYQIKPNPSEQRSIDWLHNNLGGDIIVLRPSSCKGQKISDLLWRGKPLELKHVTGNLTSMDKSIQRGLKQTNGGGVLLDVTGAKFSDQEATEKAINRLVRKGFGYVIMIRDNNLVSYIYRE